MKSFKVVVSGTDAVPVFTPSDPTFGDVLTTLINPNETLTGMYKLAQTGLVFVGGMAFGSHRAGGSWNPFGS
jgi:hypothetical protein